MLKLMNLSFKMLGFVLRMTSFSAIFKPETRSLSHAIPVSSSIKTLC